MISRLTNIHIYKHNNQQNKLLALVVGNNKL